MEFTESEHASNETITGGFKSGTTPGEFSFTTTATSYDGLQGSQTVKYKIAAPPEATIGAPTEGAVFKVNEKVGTSFSCKESQSGSELESCEDSNGVAAGPGTTERSATGAIGTSTPGEYTYSVTAVSKDGLKKTASVHYKVVAPPSAEIKSVHSGEAYAFNQTVQTKFRCLEGEDGPGLESCKDSRGNSASAGLLEQEGTGTLDTSSVGKHTYSVTALSTDGQMATTMIEYTVAMRLGAGVNSCNSIFGGSGGSVTVPAGATCTLLAGTKLSGGVQDQSSASTLIDEGAVIAGSVQVERASALQIYGAGSIGGNLIVSHLTGKPASADNEVCNTTVAGNVQVLDNSASSPIDLGNLGSCVGKPGLTVGGSLIAQSNAAQLTIAGSTIGSFLEVLEDSSTVTVQENTTTHGRISVEHDAGGTVTKNSSGESCYLLGDKPTITGTLNSTKAGDPNTCNRTA